MVLEHFKRCPIFMCGIVADMLLAAAIWCGALLIYTRYSIFGATKSEIGLVELFGILISISLGMFHTIQWYRFAFLKLYTTISFTEHRLGYAFFQLCLTGMFLCCHFTQISELRTFSFYLTGALYSLVGLPLQVKNAKILCSTEHSFCV